MVDAARLRHSFSQVAQYGDEVPLYFYSYLFLRHPETRRMFPPSMATQRDRLVNALGTIITGVDDLDSLVPFVQDLGRDHRKFGVIGEHYPAVGEALLATLEHFLGDDWSDDLASEWTEAYGLVSTVMQAAADAAAASTPAWWEAEIVAHERRAADLAVITVRTDGRLGYRPGQSLSVQTSLRPRLWRFLSPANAERQDGLIEFHVRALDGGLVSTALVHGAGVGDVLTLGPPVGELVLDTESRRDVLLLAGGTGLAPLRAMLDQMLRDGSWSRQVHLVVGGRREHDLYDLGALKRVAAVHQWLTVVPVAERPPSRDCRLGTPADVALQLGKWHEHDVYVCGSDPMVAYSRDVLARAGLVPEQVRHESFGYRENRADPLEVHTPPGIAPPDGQSGPPAAGDDRLELTPMPSHGVLTPGGEQ